MRTRILPIAAFLFSSGGMFAVIRSAQPGFFDDPDPLRANPRDAGAWIDHGLDAENRGDLTEAGHDLKEAARVDHQYAAAWTLANYAFRRQDSQLFWQAAGRAAALSRKSSAADLAPLLHLASAMEPEPRKALDRLGSTPDLERAYLDFLIGEPNLEAAHSLALGMTQDATNVPRLLDLIDREIQAGRAHPAVELWNGLAARKRIPFAPLDPERGAILTDGSFLKGPLEQGFGWRLIPNSGVVTGIAREQLQISFSGEEEEACPLAEQVIPNAPLAGRYRLDFEYQTVGLPSSTGIRWALEDGLRQESSTLRAKEAWTEAQVEFRTPAAALTKLLLLYRREPGNMRARGRFFLRKLRLKVS